MKEFSAKACRLRAIVGLLMGALSLPVGGQQGLDAAHQWPQWRGPLATGVAPHGDPPVVWSEEHNVRWRRPLPGKGHSSPIVWGDRIFLTSAVPYGETLAVEDDHAPGAHDNEPPLRRQRFIVLALDRRSGEIVWQRTVRDERPHESSHLTGSWASSSAVTDGERLFAFFGSRGLYALDLDGRPLWERDFGDMQVRHGHGEGSSPALAGDTLVVNWDHQGDSFVVALDTESGEERWRVARDEITSWSTPIVVEQDGRRQVVISATKRVRGYDLEDGALLWECGGLSRNVVASPVAGDGFVYAGNSYDWQAMLAIRLEGARGDITGTDAVAWKLDRLAPYVPSPLLWDDLLCFLRHSHGILTCLEAKSGKPRLGPARLAALHNVFASPVAAAGRLYVVSREGATVVLGRGEEFELLALNYLDDSFSASPAIVGRELFLRGEHNLYCLADSSDPPRGR